MEGLKPSQMEGFSLGLVRIASPVGVEWKRLYAPVLRQLKPFHLTEIQIEQTKNDEPENQ